MPSLQHRVAIVTGASSGIGRAATLLFAQACAAVVVGARRQSSLVEVVTEIRATGGMAVGVAGDVRDDAFAKALVQHADDHFGGLDIAFNNAGTLGPMGATPDIAIADWQQTLDTNLTGAFLGTRYRIPSAMNGTPEDLAQIAHLHALKRIAQPEEMAQAAL